MSNDDNQWMGTKATQEYLQRGDRMIRKYVSAGRIHTRLRGRRVEYYRPDVEALAAELIPESRDRVPEQAIVPSGELLNHIRDLERQLTEATAQIGYLRGILEERNLQIEEAKTVRALLTDKEHEAATLQREIASVKGSRSTGWIIAAILLILLIAAAIYILTR